MLKISKKQWAFIAFAAGAMLLAAKAAGFLLGFGAGVRWARVHHKKGAGPLVETTGLPVTEPRLETPVEAWDRDSGAL